MDNPFNEIIDKYKLQHYGKVLGNKNNVSLFYNQKKETLKIQIPPRWAIVSIIKDIPHIEYNSETKAWELPLNAIPDNEAFTTINKLFKALDKARALSKEIMESREQIGYLVAFDVDNVQAIKLPDVTKYYIGKIVTVNKYFVAQHLNNDYVILHETERFSGIYKLEDMKVGEKLYITYNSSGYAVVKNALKPQNNQNINNSEMTI